MDHSEYGRQVMHQEIQAIEAACANLGADFDRAVRMIFDCKGQLVVSGVGKAGIVGQKISATMASTGTPSHWLHAVEARHGDLGRVRDGDIVLMLSNSGETEVTQLLPTLEKLGVPVIAITGNPDSTLAHYSDVVLDIGRVPEACPLGLAPSCSTTAMLALGDALALTIFNMREWEPERYAFYHPGGELGRKLLKVREVMRTGSANPVAPVTTTIRSALQMMSGENGLGALSLVDDDGTLRGFFTDGDLRRHMIAGDITTLELMVSDFMTVDPKSIGLDDLAAEAYDILRRYRIDQIPVVDEAGRAVGILDVQDWLDVER
jgi:arabinose-5-phosphate isomerase